MKKLAVFATILCLTPNARSGGQLKMIDDMAWVVSSGFLTAMIAKEFCSCRYVVGLPLNECRKRTALLPDGVFDVINIDDDRIQRRVQVIPKLYLAIGPHAEATFNSAHPRKGCTITYGAIEQKEEFDRHPPSSGFGNN